jgi:hypothetical protein
MSTLDDLTLLQWFASGDATLEANNNLRVQPTNNLRQLFTYRGALLATAYDKALPPQIVVRRDTDYAAVLHQILLDYHYVPVGQALDSQGLTYSYHPIPDGYHIYYTPARDLWKKWWRLPYQHTHKHLQLNLFTLTHDKWYPIRDITLNRGTLYVETLRGETVHGGDESIVWLEKDQDDAAEKTQAWTTPQKAVPTVPTDIPQADSSQPPSVLTALPHPPAPPTPPLPKTPVAVDASLESVVRAIKNRLYIRTPLGIVIVEGDNLKAYGKVPSKTPTS